MINDASVMGQRELQGAAPELMKSLLRASEAHYGKDLITLAVYGSAARGDLHAQSDIDFLIVADHLPDGRWNRVGGFMPVEQAVEKDMGCWRDRGWEWELSPIIKSREEVDYGSPLFLDMIDDAVLLKDENDFFRNRLERLQATLERQGARKITEGLTWYWDLKPDFKPGDRIEL